MTRETVRFAYLPLNMEYTLLAWNAQPQNLWARTAHVIASFTLVPFILIAALEALVKNGAFLLVNLGVVVANKIYDCTRY